ncbi:Ohr family peroxiredoxin [Pseudomonas sp. SWRI111]|uniref:Ohr family peroxiredoxin n=1 Tax=Pseudomonas sp. SWRI111 TaxID=2745507 RepID=UPI001648F1BB|nr:Ohr family peroxiredoxin [Pseudomonas sp. SWRI111]MBC3207493.1 Ohr family peroxiredoxin [Pseudomonas sp. SWRI111]
MSKIEKVLATGKTHTIAHGQKGNLDIQLSSPGSAKPAHVFANALPHPTAEQLFAGAWSACYTAAVGLVANDLNVVLPADMSVDIEVDLGQTGPAYYLQARLTLRVPGIAPDIAKTLAHTADQICPYSKATRGNIDVALSVITE